MASALAAGVRVLAKPVLAVAGMLIGLLLLPGQWHVMFRIGAGGLMYLGLLALLGGIPPQLSQLWHQPRSRS